MMFDGGMVGPMMEDDAVTAAEKSLSYPSSTMAGISMEPMAAVSLTAAPVMPAKKTDARMLACANPPRRWPTSTFANLTRREVIPVLFMISPARMKKGMAMRVNMSTPAKYRWGTSWSTEGSSIFSMAARALTPSTKPMGIPTAIRIIKVMVMNPVIAASPP